jgi:hypothetical protein
MDVKSRFKSKRGIFVFALFVLIGTLTVGGLFFYQRNQFNPQTPNPTLAVLRIQGLAKNAPISLVNSQGESVISYNEKELELAPGKYQVKTQVDGVGGLDQSFEIQPNQKNNFEFSLNPEKEVNTVASAEVLREPKSVTKITIPNTGQGSNPQSYSSVSIVTPKGTNVDTINGKVVTLYTNQSEQESNDDYTKDLKLTTSDGSIDLVTNCQIYTADFDNKGENIRYFKVCPDNGQNGFYAYNLASKKESRLLVTSDPENMVRTVIDPNSNTVVFTKETGEFGIIKDGNAEVILRNTRLSAPRFTLDGKYLLLADNVGTTKGANDDLYKSFGLKVKAVEFSDLIQNREKATFKDLGLTYYVPRPDDYSFKFWDFRNSDEFRVGDSPKVFSLQKGEIEFQDDTGEITGRIYKGTDGKEYRVNGNVVYDSNNKILAIGVKQVLEKKGNIYFLINDYLYRLGDSLIQAYPNQIAGIVPSGDDLILINTQGEVLKYQF